MMEAAKRARRAVCLLICSLLLLAGCAGRTMDNAAIKPPQRGLLHYLQQEPMTNVSDNGYTVQVTAADPLQSGSLVELSLRVLDAAGKPVVVFGEDMTKLMHLIVVHRSLNTFDHLHPEYVGYGNFVVQTRFPSGGDYLLVAEFVPDGRKDLTIFKQWTTVSGPPADASLLDVDHSNQLVVDGIRFTITATPDLEEIRTGQMVMLNVAFADADTGARIQLEPYLGTGGHCVIINKQADEYVHVHAMKEMSSEHNVMFHTQFSKAGLYKLWAQFQYQGQVIVVPYVIQVQ